MGYFVWKIMILRKKIIFSPILRVARAGCATPTILWVYSHTWKKKNTSYCLIEVVTKAGLTTIILFWNVVDCPESLSLYCCYVSVYNGFLCYNFSCVFLQASGLDRFLCMSFFLHFSPKKRNLLSYIVFGGRGIFV